MAHWVQIGDRKLNMDQICAIRKAGDSVYVVFPGLSEAQANEHFEFKGDDAKKLWIAARDESRLQ